MKAVLFATGSLDTAAAEARALRERLGAESVTVVAAPGEVATLREQCECEVLPGGISNVLRLRAALGSGDAEVLCLSNGHGHRAMKLLAYALRGSVIFVRPGGRAPLSLPAFFWFTFSRWLRANGALLIGSASPATLERLAADLRVRRPDAVVEVLANPGLLDFARVAWHWRRYRYLSIPWTGEGHSLLKAAAWFLPCGQREIYNEAGDSFAVRRVGVLLAHIGRRMRDQTVRLWNGLRYAAWRAGDGLRTIWNGLRYAAWWTRDRARSAGNGLRYAAWWIGDRTLSAGNGLRYAAWWIGDRTLSAWYGMLAIPPGITVIGSASGYYMKGIVADLRKKHPGAPVYGILPDRLIAPASRLFDRVIPMRAGAILRHAFGRTRTGYFAIPCTNEGYNRYKVLGALLPLGRRLIYNENGDGYPVRRLSTMVEHGFWRLRHRLFYQAFTEHRGRSWLVLGMHLLLYPFRLVAGAFAIAGIRLRSKGPRRDVPIPAPALPHHAPAAHTPQPTAVLDPAEP
jgi:hypothetical protein